MTIMVQRALVAAVAALSLDVAGGHDSQGLTFKRKIHDTRLPKPLSDLSATLYNGKVYLAGGCDAPDGNVYDIQISNFVCATISSSFYEYDPETDGITELPSMPSARYRHGAAAVDGIIWLAGGRDKDGGLLTTVDAFDIKANKWSSYDLNEQLATSDNAVFGNKHLVYVAGGYTADYGFKDTVFAIHTETTLATNVLSTQAKAPMLEPRGDVASAVDDDGNFAMVAGGFGNSSGWCEPLKRVETYDFENDTWTRVASLNNARSDKALVELNDHMLALGGERQIEDICNIDPPEPGELTIPIDDVEEYDVDSDTWASLADMPGHRFRFAAVGLDEKAAIITFGGQVSYDEDCQCFRTTDQIVSYVEKSVEDDAHDGDGEETNGDGGGGGGDSAAAASILPLLSLVVALSAVLF